ncbi:MAG: cob(I)yrinic acid a,c-diamide adenosyltransferase [Candidatus Stahlbacteria bacterium]|nr:cob(I)yrinic acid a,c-diamide adenosyltransferase [Candidatus Stahlbacteria bacterium]
MQNRIGTIQVYTGDGKGKTTAAIGQAIRATGHRFRVIMLQFMKGKINYGELEAVKQITEFTIEQYGRPDFVDKDNPAKEDITLAKEGWSRAKEVIQSGKYDMVILDELNVALAFGLIAMNEAIEVLKNKPKHLELIITGRYATKEILELADLVTEMKEIKHHYQKGIQAREGIEY